MTQAVVLRLLEAVPNGADEMAAQLDHDIRYSVGDLPTLRGRLAVQRLWCRLLQSYASITIAPTLIIADAEIVIARQLQTFRRTTGESFELNSVAVYVVRDDRIVDWRDRFDRSDLPGADDALWRRLWRARW